MLLHPDGEGLGACIALRKLIFVKAILDIAVAQFLYMFDFLIFAWSSVFKIRKPTYTIL